MRPVRRLRPLILLSTLTLASQACGKTPEPEPANTEPAPAQPSDSPAEAKPPTPPTATVLPTTAVVSEDSPAIADLGEVVATAQIPTGTQMNDLAGFADFIQPGMAVLARMQAPQLLEQVAGMKLAGAKLDAPVSMIVVDPSKHELPLAMLVTVADAATLSAGAEAAGRGYVERDGMALIGPKDVVDVSSEFAFANLNHAPDHSEFIVYPEPLMAAAGPIIEEGMAAINQQLAAQGNGAMTSIFAVYASSLRSLSKQTQRLVISVSPSQASADLNMHLYPTPDSNLAGFVAAQAPSDHALLSKLPQPANTTIVVSGELHSGSAHPALLAFIAETTLAMYKTDLDAQAWSQMLGNWIEVLDGRIAMLVDASGMAQGNPQMAMTGLMGATDTEQMRKVWRELLVAFVKVANEGDTAMMGMGIAATFEPGIREHEGISIDRYETTLDLSKLPEEQKAMLEKSGASNQSMEFATFDNLGAMVSTENQGQLSALIDSARGKGQAFSPTSTFTAVLDDSRERGESIIYYMDVASIVPPQNAADVPFTAVSASLGRQGESLSMRLSMRK